MDGDSRDAKVDIRGQREQREIYTTHDFSHRVVCFYAMHPIGLEMVDAIRQHNIAALTARSAFLRKKTQAQ